MKISCTSTMIPRNNLTKKAEKLKKWGFDGIGVFVDYESWNEDLHQELLKLEERTGIVPCEFAFGDSLYGHLMDADSDIRRRAREMYKLAASICGELGADTALTETFLRMGVDELSMNAKSILPVRKIIRSVDLSKPSEKA
mgnify:CR=1 FL=1